MASVSEAEVLIVVDNVKEFVKQNVNLIITQKETILQVQNLCEELEKLGDLIKRERENMKLEELVISSIRELVLEAEEAIEMCAVMRKRKNTKKRSLCGFNKGDEEIEEVDMPLQKVREKIDQLFLNFDRLELLKFSKKKDQRWNDKALFPGDDKHLVGGEDQVKEVIDLLSSVANNNLKVVSITGMIGSGKTTLARKVFKDSTLESLFSLRALVSIPQEYKKNKINVLREILRQFGVEGEISGKEEAKIVEILWDCLNNSSFLIVLDDVCGTEVLDDIKSLVGQQQQGNQEKQKKVLLVVGTRRMEIYNKNQYELGRLDLKKSQELLRMEIFGEKDKKCCMELEVLEMKILGKCYGLPLAVISFARILARRREKIEWWKRVAEHVNVFTDRESLMSKAIRAIFDGLNDNLKLCFLYLGVFEKDFEIPVWKLLRLWVAEGFVTGEEENGNNKSIEDVAEDYLEELVDRNLVEVEERRSNGRIKSITVPDGLQDFCASEAKEENIFREPFFLETCRRICIRNSLVLQFHNSVPKSTTPTNSLRSILYFSDDLFTTLFNNNAPKSLLKEIFNTLAKLFRKNRTKPSGILPAGDLFKLFLSSVPKTFKLLRVLDVSSIMLPEFPTALFSLILLRYVAVSCNSSFLPKELSNLCNLQTLIIQILSELETLEIRADVRDMPLLRHIYCNIPILVRILKTTAAAGSVINQNLQTISRISPKSCTTELFEKIPNLGTLSVFGKLSMKEEIGTTTNNNNNNHGFFEHIMELNRLRNLKLLNDSCDEDNKDKNSGGKENKQNDKNKDEDDKDDKQKDKNKDEGDKEDKQKDKNKDEDDKDDKQKDKNKDEDDKDDKQKGKNKDEDDKDDKQKGKNKDEDDKDDKQKDKNKDGDDKDDKQKDKDKDKDDKKKKKKDKKKDEEDKKNKYVLPPITSGSFPNLTNLTLLNTYLSGENMNRIGKLENLEILKLKGSKFEDDSWESKDGGFVKLRVLLVKVTNLKQWKATANHFPRLASLFLWHCNNLQVLPVGLPDMQCLETVDLSFGHDDLASSLKTILLPKLENQPGFQLTIFPPYK